MFYGHCVKICEDFSPNLGDNMTDCCIMTPSHTLFLSRESFTKNNMTVFTYLPYSSDLVPCYFSLFPQMNIKLKGRHFDTTEVIETEPQAMLNTLTEHDFKDAFKKRQKHWEWCKCTEGDYYGDDGGRHAQS
jgi:hypothetical protein